MRLGEAPRSVGRPESSVCLYAFRHERRRAWLPSAKVLHAELDRVAGDLPVILVGGFNCAAGSDAHHYLHDEAAYRDVWREAGHSDDGVLTYNGFTLLTRLPDDAERRQHWLKAASIPIDTFAHDSRHVRAHENYRIDWILLRGPIAISAIIDYRSDNGLLPSDHYPVVAHIEYALAP